MKSNHLSLHQTQCGSCNLDHGGTFIAATTTCSDNAYTTGNLGKSWAELDLVPHRVTLENNDGTQTFTFIIAGDYLNGAGTATGWDVVSAPVLNTSLSDASCSDNNVVVGDQTITPSGDGVGGADQTIYRTVKLTMTSDEVCVYDYYQRLALGAHNSSGSSLQSNLWNENLSSSGIGQKRIQLPVSEIAPQSISKTMSASQGTDHIWLLEKHATPATIDFGNTCATGAPLSAGVTITVTWTKGAADPSGPVTIVTHVYATNPAHRALDISVSDVIYAGTTQTTPLNTATATATVPANTADFLVLTHTLVVNSTATSFNDVATASYTDTLTGIPIPGTVTASASATVQSGGTEANQTATITDSESITGSGLTFSVAAPLVGTFTGTPAYVAGTHTVGPVAWSSGTQTGSGSVSFSKTIYVTAATATTGTLSDSATLTGSDGASASASASVDISASPTGTLTINKTIPGPDNISHTFTFEVRDGATVVATKTITIAAGATTGSVTASGLTLGTTYTVVETDPDGYTQPSNQDVVLTGCTASVDFSNTFGPAQAQVRKVTTPAGSEAGWHFLLNGPGIVAPGVEAVTTGTGYVTFPFDLQEGTYTVTEVTQTGWDLQSPTTCSFTVDYPADSDAVFQCTFTNVQRGNIALVKTQSGGAIPAGSSFTFQVRSGASTASDGTVLSTVVVTSATVMPVNLIAPNTLVPGVYQVCEFILPGWNSTIRTQPGAFVPNSLGDPATIDNSYVCAPVTVTAGATTTLTIDNTPPPGGMAKTIGFWKNWSSCKTSNGKQAPILDQTLALAPDGGFLVGDEFVNTCQEAYNLLNKSDLSGKKQASLPEFNFASQYTAYQLNLLAGAGTCPAATAAAAEGQAILDSYNFIGNAITPKVSKTDAATLNKDAGILDAYNNNTLCP